MIVRTQTEQGHPEQWAGVRSNGALRLVTGPPHRFHFSESFAAHGQVTEPRLDGLDLGR